MRMSRAFQPWEIFGHRSPEEGPLPRRNRGGPGKMPEPMSEPRLISEDPCAMGGCPLGYGATGADGAPSS
jgi:hypothetical protein